MCYNNLIFNRNRDVLCNMFRCVEALDYLILNSKLYVVNDKNFNVYLKSVIKSLKDEALKSKYFVPSFKDEFLKSNLFYMFFYLKVKIYS